MITAEGYSNDPNIVPEGIVLTLPVAFFKDRGMSCTEFEKYFLEVMEPEDAIWNFRLSNLPLLDVQYVYLIFEGFLQYRGNLVMYERNKAKRFNDTPDGKTRTFSPCNWVLFTGPIIKCPFERQLKGFQGFRYSTKLF